MTSATMFKSTPSGFSGRARAAGFTLVELLVTMGVIAVLTMVAVPSFKGFIGGQQVRSASFDITAALLQARSEAIKRNVIVTITPTASAWINGWSLTAASGATLELSQHEAFPNGLAISGPTTIAYNGSGRLTVSTAPVFSITKSGITRTATITVDTSGLPKTVAVN
jgi:type IV fimbrial biogenesis protein FimT